MGQTAKGLLKCPTKRPTHYGNKEEKKIKQGNDMIKLCFGETIPLTKLDGEGEILTRTAELGLQRGTLAAEARALDVLL